jgi:hypothetical protein
LIVGLSILACLAVGSVMWFISTEPPAPNTPSKAQDDDSVGSRAEIRSASQTIRAARRSQERSQVEASGE